MAGGSSRPGYEASLSPRLEQTAKTCRGHRYFIDRIDNDEHRDARVGCVTDKVGEVAEPAAGRPT